MRLLRACCDRYRLPARVDERRLSVEPLEEIDRGLRLKRLPPS